MGLSGRRAIQLALFAAALVATGFATRNDSAAVRESLVWLPSGVAVAGVLLLGYRAAWIVALAAFAWRAYLDYPLTWSVSAAVGSSAEALLGAWLILRLRIGPGLHHLRDVLAIYLAAILAPMASIAASWIARTWDSPDPGLPFWSGWGGWWRMNAVAILLLVPLALAWQGRPGARSRTRTITLASAWSTAALATVAVVTLLIEPGVPAILMLASLLLISFAAALHLGSQGTTSTACLGAIAIAITAGHGLGPLQAVAVHDRHLVAQILLVGLAALPMLFGVLLAERDADAARWLDSGSVATALLRILPDVTFRLGADGTVLDAVAPLTTPQPIPVQDLIGRRIHDIPDPGLRNRLLDQLRRAQQKLPTESIEYPLSTDQGERHCEARFVALPNGEALAVARDITDRTQAARQLRLQARILEMIATGSRHPEVFTALVAGVESQIPHGRCSILLRHGNRLHVATAPTLPDEYNHFVEGLEIGPNQGACGTAAFTNEVVICSDLATDERCQRLRQIAARFGLRACWSVPVRSAAGLVLGTFAIYHTKPQRPRPADIALVEQAAILAGLALDRERREELLASIQQNVSDGLFRSIPGEGFVHVNTSFARLFGYASADELLREWPGCEPGPHRDSLQLLVAETASWRNREVPLHRRDGHAFWALVSTNVTLQDDDAELVCDGTITDITSYRALEDQLRQSQKMEAVGQLAGGVAHDFNNLLTAISGFAQSVYDDLPELDPLRRDVAQIIEAGRRAAGLTRQLLAFGRRQMLSPEVIDLPTVVDDVSDMLRRLISDRIELVHEPATRSIRAKVDRGQLEQVLLNLVINARDAMPDGGRITIITTTRTMDESEPSPHPELPPGRYAVMQVVDTGTGMPPDVQARAFEPFFTTKAPGQGTGLGLSTVYGIVKQSGGAVTIQSEAGGGTTISVYLPFAHELPASLKPVLVPRVSRTDTILVVEDEPFVRELAERALGQAGHRVLATANGELALQQFAAHGERIRMVITDMVMPVMGGQELGQRLRAQQPTLPILFMSGYVAKDGDLTKDHDPWTAFVHKPFTASQLLAQVDRMLVTTAQPRPEQLTSPDNRLGKTSET